MFIIDPIKKKKYDIVEITEFKQDIVTAFPIELRLKGIIYQEEFNIEFEDNLREYLRYLILEVYPFGQQLCRPITNSFSYDYVNETTTIKINLNEWCYDFRHMIFDARYININSAWRESVYLSWPRDVPWGYINEHKIIGPFENAYVNIDDYANLNMPISEIIRQMILNQQFQSIPNPELNIVNIRKRPSSFRKHIIIEEAIDVEDDYKDVELPLGIQFKKFVQDAISHEYAYPNIAYYEFKYNETIERFEVIWIGKEPSNNSYYSEGIEKVLVEDTDYDVQDDDTLRSIAQERLDNLEYNNNVTVTFSKNSMTMRQFDYRVIFSHLGELFHIHLKNNSIMSGKLTSIKYDFTTEIFTLVFGTKRIRFTEYIKKELMK